MQYLKAIDETSYLSVPNSPLYRKIMRFFYKEYEKMHFQLYKEDVFEFLRGEPEYADYTMEKLNLDLDALVAWKNLTPIQDPGRVYTIADYKNKQFRYTMSEYAVEIERLTVRLENLFMESGNLSTNYFVRLKKGLSEADRMTQAGLKDINEWWHMLQEDFKCLNQNYQDYLREFYSGKSENLLKSVEFVMHKDKFIKYLNDFVQELQLHSKEIEVILNRMIPLIEEKLLEKVVQSELDIPHALPEKNGDLEPNIRENVWGKWTSLKNWFIDSPGYECECQKVLKITNDTIRSIIQNAALIVQMQNWGISRKDDYRKFLEMFLQCEDLDEAHRLAAHVFGIQNIHHLKTVDGRDSDAINRSVYDEEPMEYVIKPHTRSYREKKDRQGFVDKTLEKWSQRNDYLQKVQQEKEVVLHYIKNNKIIFSEINEVVSEHTKNVFLQWIAQANMNSQKKGRTEYGQEYELTKMDGICNLECEDGKLTMPAYVMEFRE
ncbi:MAG: TIGR02677 family protein [Eubacterium sp.]|nr:TIGR02677 family protein [Eubacterium sp.]